MKTQYYLENIRSFVELLRVRNCIIASMGVLTSSFFVYLGGDPVVNTKIIMAVIATFLITGGGNIINDYFDIEIDKINKPKRPIPSGRVSRSDAFMFSMAIFLMGIGLSKGINNYCLIIGGLNTMLLVLYGAYSKRIGFLSNITVGYLVASIFLFGVLSTLTDGLESIPEDEAKIVAIVAGCAFLITVSREIIKDIEDIEGDRYKYSSTVPIKIGEKKAKKIAILFGFGAILLSLLPFFMGLASFNLYVYGIAIVLVDIIFIFSLFSPPFIGQRTMIIGMLLALMAFFLGKFIHTLA